MITRLFLFVAIVSILVFSIPASADVALADWCVNDNGSVGSGSNQPSNSCNGGTLAPDAHVNIGSFDTTLEPSSNALSTGPQSITVTFGTGLQNIGAFMNYDIAFSSFGSNGDYGTVVGTPPGTFSYEMDNEFTSSIFSDFAAGALTDANNVSFAACSPNFPPFYCDASWAMDWTANVNPALFTGGKIVYTASLTVPTTPFYLEQTSGFTGENIYLSADVTLTPKMITGVPEPATWPVLAAAGCILFVMRKRLVARAQ